ncbi:MAG: IS1634 family transposase [Proteobacteria bacterium]|nr:IS1634 family transposase [Pseudomonadota bacterium]MBU4469730.1 IS1634 family transposase [Pseudomonadota bacterium]
MDRDPLYSQNMFIRETVKTKKGKKYTQHQLVESVRTPHGPRQVLVLNLGFLDLPRDQWKELANTIESELHKQKRLFTGTPEIESLARHYAEIIVKQKLLDTKEVHSVSAVYESVDIDSIETTDVKTIGAEHVAMSSLQEYGFEKILKSLNFSDKEIGYAKMLIVARLVHPASELETARWINENSALCELMATQVLVYDTALHRSACLLFEHHEAIERGLAETARGLFDLKETVILYDLTNTYFEGSKRGSRLAKPGKSKERRDDRPLVTLALTVDEEGFPKQSKILEGNIGEPGTLEGMLDQLGTDTQKTIVMDAGIASESNLALIKGKGFKYVAVSRKRSYRDDFWQGSLEKNVLLSDGTTELKVRCVQEDGELFLQCHSIEKELKEKAILDKKSSRFEQEMKKLQEGLSKKNTQKKYAAIVEKIGRLKERYGVGSLYDITMESDNDKVRRIDFVRNASGMARDAKVGKYVLRTNRTDLSEEEISKIHRSLTRVEDSFRSMKSHLGLRPIHHKRDDTTTAHIFITVLAYHILAGILRKLGAHKIDYNWQTIRNLLSNHVRVTTTFNTEDESTIHIRNSSVPTLNQQAIYKSLNIKQQPLGRIKLKTPLKKPAVRQKCSEENPG